MARIIINLTALRNNGDVALITALNDALVQRGHDVTVATPRYSSNKRLPGRLALCSEVLGLYRRSFRLPILGNLAAIFSLIFIPEMRKADIVIGAPGGYMNSYYGFEWKFTLYKWARRFGKRAAVYAQSVGPLNEEDSKLVPSMHEHIDLLMCRDSISYEVALSAGIDPNIVSQSVDAIFLNLPSKAPRSASSRTVAVSVREWRHDNRRMEHFLDLMTKICNRLLDLDFDIEFVSTCQGIPGYIDDSLVARKIYDRVAKNNSGRSSVTVITDPMGIDELKERISGYRMVVGTRLHMCLLSLMSGIPAFNISYESKGKQCFNYLGMENFTIDYNAPIPDAMEKLDYFIESEEDTRDSLPSKIKEHHLRAHRDLDEFLAKLT